jgi:DNA-binding GntR family transcriptional regulator
MYTYYRSRDNWVKKFLGNPFMRTPRLTVVNEKSLAERIADSIVEGIASRSFVPGQRLLEVNLASELGVSRVPVREALKILHTQGIVVGRPHYGVSPAAYDNRKITQIYEVRCYLEKTAVKDAKQRNNISALLRRLDETIAAMEQALKRGDLMGVSKADLRFHHEICRASENEIILVLWEALSRHMLIVFEQELLGDAESASIVDHHRALRQALEVKSAEELEREIEDHIMRLRGFRPGASRQAARSA